MTRPSLGIYGGAVAARSIPGIRPGDVYPLDTYSPPIPAAYANALNAIPILHIFGYLPAADAVPGVPNMPWIVSGSNFWSYGGQNVAGWIGDRWINTTALATGKRTLLAGGSGGQPAVVPSSGDLNLYAYPRSQWVTALNAFYTANPVTPWTDEQAMWLFGFIIKWDGSSWVILHEPPFVADPTTDPKRLYPGVQLPMYAASVTSVGLAASYLNANGYLPGIANFMPWRSIAANHVMNQTGYASFINPTNVGLFFLPYWNGSSWISSAISTSTPVAPGDTQVQAQIAALPANQQIVAINEWGYIGSPVTPFTSGQFATIAGRQVHWHGGAGASDKRWWMPGAAP